MRGLASEGVPEEEAFQLKPEQNVERALRGPGHQCHTRAHTSACVCTHPGIHRCTPRHILTLTCTRVCIQVSQLAFPLSPSFALPSASRRPQTPVPPWCAWCKAWFWGWRAGEHGAWGRCYRLAKGRQPEMRARLGQIPRGRGGCGGGRRMTGWNAGSNDPGPPRAPCPAASRLHPPSGTCELSVSV